MIEVRNPAKFNIPEFLAAANGDSITVLANQRSNFPAGKFGHPRSRKQALKRHPKPLGGRLTVQSV